MLTRDRTRRWVIETLAGVRQEHDVQLGAYVIMPEHVHVLIYPNRSDYKMRNILAALKRPVSIRAREHLERSGSSDWLQRLTVKYPTREVFRFWQPGGGFDHNIFKERTVAKVIEYIHENPVRRCLVKHAWEWEWSSARFWENRGDASIRMDEPFV